MDVPPARSVGASARRSESFLIPHVRLRAESIVVDRGSALSSAFEEIETGVIELSFDYMGTRVRASDPRDAIGTGRLEVTRDRAAEERVRRILEGFGVVDLRSVDDCATSPGSTADYAIDLAGDPQDLCHFHMESVAQLRALGWRVDVDDDYPCQVVEGVGWYAKLDDLNGDGDWFQLEFGVDVDGQRIDLRPFIMELIERGQSLRSLTRPGPFYAELPAGRRRFAAVPRERVQAIACILAELYEVEGISRRAQPRLPANVPNYFERLEAAFAGADVVWEGDSTLRSRVRSLGRNVRLAPVAPSPLGLHATLRPYQRHGVAWLQCRRQDGFGVILADDMGLGKTLQTIAHFVLEKHRGGLRAPVLVVAPTSLVENWRRELARFAPGLCVLCYRGPDRKSQLKRSHHHDVILTTYGLLARDVDRLRKRRFSTLVLDEAQSLKNPRSQVHRAARTIDAEHKVCLTGTPIENNLGELWALFDLLNPGLLGSMAEFRERFAKAIEIHGNEERLASLRARIEPFILRRTKDAVAPELPPKSEIVRTVDLRDDQRDLYEAIRVAAHADVRKAIKRKGIAGSTIDVLGALLKLRQVCCDPRLARVHAAADVTRSAKLETLLEMVEQMLPQGRRILIFSQFASMLALIGRELRDKQIPHACLTGATANRQASVDAFENRAVAVFLISLKAGGTGLNLTSADTVIHYDPWWNPAVQVQATDRAYRIGQKRSVFVYHLVARGSVEERMLALQNRKKVLADSLLGDQTGGGNALTEAEVHDLFAPLEC